MGGRDRTAVLLKEALKWNYTKALWFVRSNREAILALSAKEGTTFPEAAFKLAGGDSENEPEDPEDPKG